MRAPPTFSESVGGPLRRSSFADDAEIQAPLPLPEPDEETLSTGPLSLSTRLEYAALKTGEAYNAFGLVSLQASELAEEPGNPREGEERTPVDITCVLDVSGSMNSLGKLELVKGAVSFIIDEMKSGDRLSLVTFNSSASRVTPLLRMDGNGKDQARQALCRLCAQGGTSIAAGLDTAIANMEQRRQRNPVGAVFLLTDGQDRTSSHQVQTLVSRARSAQCSLYTFGFGADHDAKLLTSFAEAAQTPFTFVEQLDAVRGAFAGAVSGLMSVMAQAIELTIVPEGDCALAAVHTHFAQRRLAGEAGPVVVSIPDAFAGERRNIVVELRVPAQSDPATLLRTSAQYRAVRPPALVQTPEVLLAAARTPEPEGEPDAEVTAQRQRVEVTNALEQAVARCEAGNFEEAQHVLRENAERLRSSPTKTPVSDALLGELDDARQRMCSRQAFSSGGHAEVADAMQMYRMERCTNTSSATKSSKRLFSTNTQNLCIERSSRS